MPLYLLLDLLGKFLILLSVGCQLLWLAPIASSRDTNRQDFTAGLLLANHQVNMIQLKAGTEKEEDVRFMVALMWDPEEAVEAFRLCGARQAIGHHWGTFQLTDEGYDQPPKELKEALVRTGLSLDQFSTLLPGRSLHLHR